MWVRVMEGLLSGAGIGLQMYRFASFAAFGARAGTDQETDQTSAVVARQRSCQQAHGAAHRASTGSSSILRDVTIACVMPAPQSSGSAGSAHADYYCSSHGRLCRPSAQRRGRRAGDPRMSAPQFVPLSCGRVQHRSPGQCRRASGYAVTTDQAATESSEHATTQRRAMADPGECTGARSDASDPG